MNRKYIILSFVLVLLGGAVASAAERHKHSPELESIDRPRLST